MAQPIKAITERSGISHFFGVADVGVIEGNFEDETTIWHIGDPDPEWFMVGPNGVTFSIEGEAKAYVRYELWDTQPPPIDPSWRSWEGQIYLASGRIVAVSYYDEADYYTPFDLGRQATNWLVRISAKTPTNDTDPEFPSKIYRASLFKLQFWTTGRGARLQ
ncbi:hypothetical protein ACFOY2_13015 [Nonomuraea purpurea]|uniref:Uncharacterized protein n=1 Tax=Nonomuraea purpurea TaxID=1849276 RepID=A0ABV8G2C2_9ACTN